MHSNHKKTKIILLILLILIILCSAGYILYLKYFTNNSNNEVQEPVSKLQQEEKKSVQIYKGTDRTIAVMIDNHKEALPQGGLNDAYMVYEIIVEGGESRLMALFKGTNPEKIGPVRSSRHYFLDYALENDAIYVHYGWSPQAESDISTLKVNNINGITESETSFWRTKDKSSPHNVATTIEKIKEIAERKGYRTTSDSKSVLNYVTDEVDLTTGVNADTVIIPYSDSNIVKYEYDSETKRYQRYSKGVKEVEWSTKENITTKNIIITFVKNSTLNDSENKGRQTIDNIKTLDGYYITDGKAIKITCEKSSRSGKTIYKDLSGNEIKVNDGNTFMQICPIDAKVKITANDDSSNTNTINSNKEN